MRRTAPLPPTEVLRQRTLTVVTKVKSCAGRVSRAPAAFQMPPLSVASSNVPLARPQSLTASPLALVVEGFVSKSARQYAVSDSGTFTSGTLEIGRASCRERVGSAGVV